MNHRSTRFEILKSVLFAKGHDAIKDFIGSKVNASWNEDKINEMMDIAYEQKSFDEMLRFYNIYKIKAIGRELYIEFNDHSHIYFNTDANDCKTAFAEFKQTLQYSGINTDKVLIKPTYCELRDELNNVEPIDTMSF